MRRQDRSGNVKNSPGDIFKNVHQKKKKKVSAVKEYLMDYSANSNLHGLRYIGEKRRTVVEKLFWIIMFVCSIGLCSYLIWKVWMKWNNRPVIVSFAETSTPVWQIPFPAVTVCVGTKSKQTLFNYTEAYRLHFYEITKYQNLTEYERNLFEDLSLVCDDSLSPLDGRKFSVANETIANLRKVAPSMKESTFACKWKDIDFLADCNYFYPVITREGFCFTFNGLGAEDVFRMENLHSDYKYIDLQRKNHSWSLEDGYHRNTPLETYPHRGFFKGFGSLTGFLFMLNAIKEDLDYLCRGPVQGFKVFLHNPVELPGISQQYFTLPLDQEVTIAVKPKMMTTSEGLRDYPADKRQCYFPGERYLHYFKTYTQANCKMECLTNFTFVRCGCVHFGMPHGPNVPLCNVGSVGCIKETEELLLTIEIRSGIERESKINSTKTPQVAAKCNCLPACTSIEYEAESSSAYYDVEAFFRVFEVPEVFQGLAFSRAFIYFKEAQLLTLQRSELYGWTDFLANSGGLLGLFMGFSILSVVEILYFLTLRLYCVLWQKKHAKVHASSRENQIAAD